MRYWKEYYFEGVEISAHLDTKNHRWEFWFGSMYQGAEHLKGWREPDYIFTKARGQSVIELLDGLKTKTRTKGVPTG